MLRKPIAALALACLVATLAVAATQDAPLFDYRQIELENGLTVITLEDFSCPIVSVQLWYHVGSKDERPDRQGFAHMFEHMMFRGTDRLGSTDHFDLIRQTGGECNAATAFDTTHYFQTLPANQLDLALWLEAERMSFLAVNQGNFDTERKVVEEELRQGRDGPYGTLADQLLEALFTVHPYRWTPGGKIAHLRSAAVQELRDFWQRYYVPNNATLVIVGAVSHAQAQQAARQYFGWIPRGDDPPRVTIREPLPTAARQVTFKEKNAPTPIVGLVYRTVPAGHPDQIPLDLLATILGGGESSRIYRDLVAETQAVTLAAAASLSLQQDGIFGVGAVLPPFGGKPGKEVLERLLAHVERLRTEPVTERELTKARNQMLAQIVAQNLTVETKATVLAQAAVVEGDVANVNRALDDVRTVTADDLLRVAREYLAPERVMQGTVERNLLGTLLGARDKSDDGAVTAVPEAEAPPPGRPGVARPDNYPAKPPIAGPLESAPAPALTTRTLPNGLKVMVVPNHEVPYVTIELGLLTGGFADAKPGTAPLALAMLTKGTATHTEGELAEELETYAISLGGNATLDYAAVSAGCLTEQLERAMGFLAEVVRTPTFPAEEFDKLRNQVRTGMTIREQQPEYLADRQLRRVLFGDHPYARTADGELKDVDALTVEDLKQWWQTHARPDAAVLILAGDIESDRAMQLVEAALGDWQASGPRPAIELPPPPTHGPTHIYLVDRAGPQSQIRVGQLGITRQHPGYFVSRVVSGYFGGAFSARLMETIRVKKGLTYGVGGGYSADRFAGKFIISTFSKTESTAEAVQAILEEIERLRTEGPSDTELSTFKSYVAGSFAGRRETPQQLASDLWLLEYCGLQPDYFDRLLAGVAQTTADECLKFVNETVDPDRLSIVVVGSARDLEEELGKIAPVTVVRASQPAAEQPATPADEAGASDEG